MNITDLMINNNDKYNHWQLIKIKTHRRDADFRRSMTNSKIKRLNVRKKMDYLLDRWYYIIFDKSFSEKRFVDINWYLFRFMDIEKQVFKFVT